MGWFSFEILLTYNTKLVHRTTGLVPSEARKEENEVKVWTKTVFINNLLIVSRIGDIQI